ncbi:autotransporter outer membrane beta-barrel domain-containing protein [Pseudomonas sp. C2B4]|uniref:autotransporter outer membrane beta-barrel domain-containing protein n=1 Tax=Pseudomonas sp. C2B4 TaxID=2735270 RepID=UPI0015868062|nr:autotransporter outer membrane beta-barrel domain-containing protein [Pseudomonas sp. C2B4]NUU37705.1 autotransporter outer membrane beta-barrel domain-containing protein [Pseudomonas sp. C2B4]
MIKVGLRLSRVSVSSALLLLGAAPGASFADSCDTISCQTTSETNLVVNDNSTVNIGTGGTIVNSTVSYGHINIYDLGASVGTEVHNTGWLQINDNASAQDSIVNGGQMVVVGSATAVGTLVNRGFFDASENATVSNTRLEGGAMFVSMQAQARNTSVNNSEMNVFGDALADHTTVNNGGLMSVFDSASISDTVVNQGGQLDIEAGTVVHNTTVNQGGLMVMGDQAQASETTINQGGSLQLKGDAILGFNTHVDGNVSFADPAVNGFHTLTIKGPLTGNGSFLMNTDLAALQGDLLKVQGPVSDTHTLVVADSGNAPSGALQRLLLVDGNGGSGSFNLHGQTVDAGAYRYQLQQQGDDWYLANLAEVEQPEGTNETQEPVDPADPVAPVDPVDPVAPVFPVAPAEPDNPVQPPRRPQAETLSKGANAAVASQAASAALIGAQMSATVDHFGDLRSGKDQGGLWTRGYGAEQRLDTGSSRAFQQQINGMEIGADKALPFADGTLYVGGLVGQGQGRQDFGEASKGTIDSMTLGGYASYLDRSGLYVDGALKYSRLDNDINITSNLGDKVKAHYKNHAVSADVQVGKHIDLGQGWFVEPQAGLQVARISEGRYTASNGLSVEQDAMMSVQSRVGGVVGRDLQLGKGVTVKPYAKATWITEHAGDSHVMVSGAKLDSSLPGSRGEIGGGVMVTAAEKHNVYVEGAYTKGSDIEQPWAVTVGYRYNW